MQPRLMIGLVVALGLTAWVATQSDDEAIEPVRRAGGASAPKRSSTTRQAAPQKVDSKMNGLDAENLVASVTLWQARVALAPLVSATLRPWGSQRPPPPPPPPPMAVVAPPPPPPPMAPPFPHAWVGRFNDEKSRAIVTSVDAMWVVAAGDVIEGQWRVDSIKERQMTLTYLPLKQHQTVAMKTP